MTNEKQRELNVLEKEYYTLCISHGYDKESLLNDLKNHQLMIPKNLLTLDHKIILCQTYAMILIYIKNQSMTLEKKKADQLNKLADTLNPMDNGWWGLYDDTYHEYISSETYERIHNEILTMYESLFN